MEGRQEGRWIKKPHKGIKSGLDFPSALLDI